MVIRPFALMLARAISHASWDAQRMGLREKEARGIGRMAYCVADELGLAPEDIEAAQCVLYGMTPEEFRLHQQMLAACAEREADGGE